MKMLISDSVITDSNFEISICQKEGVPQCKNVD